MSEPRVQRVRQPNRPRRRPRPDWNYIAGIVEMLGVLFVAGLCASAAVYHWNMNHHPTAVVFFVGAWVLFIIGALLKPERSK